MSGGEVAGLVVAVFWAILVAFLAVVLVRLAQVLKEASRLVSGVTSEAVPLLGQAAETVRDVGVQLERVDAITADVKEVTAHASALSGAVSSALGGPLVKLAAFGYGLRRAAVRAGDRPAPVSARSGSRPKTWPGDQAGGRVFRARAAIGDRRGGLAHGDVGAWSRSVDAARSQRTPRTTGRSWPSLGRPLRGRSGSQGARS